MNQLSTVRLKILRFWTLKCELNCLLMLLGMIRESLILVISLQTRMKALKKDLLWWHKQTELKAKLNPQRATLSEKEQTSLFWSVKNRWSQKQRLTNFSIESLQFWELWLLTTRTEKIQLANTLKLHFLPIRDCKTSNWLKSLSRCPRLTWDFNLK